MKEEANKPIYQDSRYKVPNLERALVIMEYLMRHPEGAGISDLTEALNISKNSVFRITMTLLGHGYLNRDEDTKRFTLSRKLLAMGTEALTEQHLIASSLDVMKELRDITGETVLIGTIVDDSIVVMDQVLGKQTFKFAIDIGARVNLHTSAPGKAMLAYFPPAEVDQVLKTIKFTKYNENTITTLKAFRKELDKSREQGYGTDCAEELCGVHCVGAPVFDRNGYPVAAIWTTGPADRITKERLDEIGSAMVEKCGVISKRLGYGILER